MKNFSLLILCAGFGRRMLDLTVNVPKPLLKIKNKTLLGNTINFFKDIGCNEIFINTHFLHNKIENYISENYKSQSIKIINEPLILGTGGGVKNAFNYTSKKNICVVNSDILWNTENKLDVLKFVSDLYNIKHCKILLSKDNNFYGLKKNIGDFDIKDGKVLKRSKESEIIFYSGLQIVSRSIFENTPKIFSINKVWEKLITEKNLKGSLISSKILHLGDKNSFHNL